MQLCVRGPQEAKNIELCFNKVVKEYFCLLKDKI